MDAIFPELGMPDGHFVAHLTPVSPIGATGAEDVEFRVALNDRFPTFVVAVAAPILVAQMWYGAIEGMLAGRWERSGDCLRKGGQGACAFLDRV